ncbi:MAG: IS66 family transposase [Phocaeicola vulgatus]
MDGVPGTHASSTFMAYLAFNKYVLDTPLYREISRILDEDMRLSRMTLTNWLEKGSFHINKLIGFLKECCLEKDSVINCDESLVQGEELNPLTGKGIYGVLSSEAEKIVIYCYEDGSRGHDVLRHILGDHGIKALQSDGYNVYMYLDDNLTDIEHVCCMAHARAKFKYALEQGGDLDAAFFLDCMGELYVLEAEYEHGRLSPEQIKTCRNNLKTKEIIIRLRSKLDALLSDDHPPRGELMEKALRYLKAFWARLFAYTHGGSYTIDNSIAERFAHVP